MEFPEPSEEFEKQRKINAEIDWSTLEKAVTNYCHLQAKPDECSMAWMEGLYKALFYETFPVKLSWQQKLS